MIRKSLEVLSGLLFSAAILCLATTNATASDVSEPQQRVETTISQIRKTVVDEKSALSYEQLGDKLEAIIDPVFDFSEMSRRSLGKNWSKGNDSQQQEFVKLFGQLLLHSYLAKVVDGIEKSSVNYDQTTVNDDKAVVRTTITNDEQTVSVMYRMRKKDDGWRVYDVVIENIGLVSNYRTEFNSIVRSKGFDELLAVLRKKTEETRNKRAENAVGDEASSS